MKMLDIKNVLIGVASLLMIYYVYHLWKNRCLYYYGSKFGGPLGLPIIGSTYYFIGGNNAILESILWFANKYKGPFVKFWNGNQLCILAKEPKYVEILLKNNLAKSPLYDPVKEALGNGLPTAPVEIWKYHRRIINQIMNPNILISLIDNFVKHSNKCVSELKQKFNESQIDLFPILFKYSLDMICETTLDNTFLDSKEQNQFISNVLRLQELVILRTLKPWWKWIWKFMFAKEFKSKLSQVEKFVTQGRFSHIIHKHLKKIGWFKNIQMKRPVNNQSESKKKYFLNYLLNLKNEKLTDHEIFEETQTLIVTGSETTALTENYVVLMLAMHREIQENVFREISDILKNSDTITHHDINRMVYLERVIKETMRLFALVPLIARFLQENVELDSYVLPKGSTVMIPIPHLHKNPQFWPDPLKFNPDRFLPEEVAKRPSCSYIPFSSGRRNCLGFQYGMMSMKVLLASLIRNFKISTTQYKTISDVKLEYAITIKPKNAFKIVLEERK